MEFETYDKMKRYFNNNRSLFLDYLQTDLFLEEFPGLLPGTRERIRCRFNNEGSRSANSLLLDSIMKVEKFPEKFISFCRQKNQCLDLAEHIKKEYLKITKGRKTSNGAKATKHGSDDSNAGSGKSHGTTATGQNSRDNVLEVQTPASGRNLNTTGTSSFFYDSIDLAGAIDENLQRSDRLAEQHTISDLKANLCLSVHEPENMVPNIPPSGGEVVQYLHNTEMVTPQFKGIQCEEDVEKYIRQACSPGAASANDKNCRIVPDPHVTFPKTVCQDDDEEGKVSHGATGKHESKNKVTYFDLNPCDLLGIPVQPVPASNQEDSMDKNKHKVGTTGDGDIAPVQDDKVGTVQSQFLKQSTSASQNSGNPDKKRC